MIPQSADCHSNNSWSVHQNTAAPCLAALGSPTTSSWPENVELVSESVHRLTTEIHQSTDCCMTIIAQSVDKNTAAPSPAALGYSTSSWPENVELVSESVHRLTTEIHQSTDCCMTIIAQSVDKNTAAPCLAALGSPTTSS